MSNYRFSHKDKSNIKTLNKILYFVFESFIKSKIKTYIFEKYLTYNLS